MSAIPSASKAHADLIRAQMPEGIKSREVDLRARLLTARELADKELYRSLERQIGPLLIMVVNLADDWVFRPCSMQQLHAVCQCCLNLVQIAAVVEDLATASGRDPIV